MWLHSGCHWIIWTLSKHTIRIDPVLAPFVPGYLLSCHSLLFNFYWPFLLHDDAVLLLMLSLAHCPLSDQYQSATKGQDTQWIFLVFSLIVLCIVTAVSQNRFSSQPTDAEPVSVRPYTNASCCSSTWEKSQHVANQPIVHCVSNE